MKILVLIIAFVSTSLLTGNAILFQSCRSASVDSGNIKPAAETTVASSTRPPSSDDIRRWIAPTFLGLKVGESNEKDVQRLFGKPDAEYPSDDEDKVFETQAEDEVVQDYRNLKHAGGHVVIILGKKTRLVKGITLYPSNNLSLDEALTKYGKDFFQIQYPESICIREEAKSGIVDKNLNPPLVLIYPNLGLLVDIRKDQETFYVSRFDYFMDCN